MRNEIKFIINTDKFKSIKRQTSLIDSKRRETDSDHCWQLALMAMVFKDIAEAEGVDINKVIQLVIIHDIPEILTGDVCAFEEYDAKEKSRQENTAMSRICSPLGSRFHWLWTEYEDKRLPESKFAHALDGLQPLILNYYGKGDVWERYGVTEEKCLAQLDRKIKDNSPGLYEIALEIFELAKKDGRFVDSIV